MTMLLLDVPPMAVLGIDQGLKSGHALHVPGCDMHHGMVKLLDADAVVAVVRHALDRAAAANVKLLVFFEDHGAIAHRANTRFDKGKRPTINQRTILGMGAARGVWEHELRRNGHRQDHMTLVASDTWRKAVLGMSDYRGRANLKASAVQWASGFVSQTITDDNQAEAIGMCAYGAVEGVRTWQREQDEDRERARVARAKRREKVGDDGWH